MPLPDWFWHEESLCETCGKNPRQQDSHECLHCHRDKAKTPNFGTMTNLCGEIPLLQGFQASKLEEVILGMANAKAALKLKHPHLTYADIRPQAPKMKLHTVSVVHDEVIIDLNPSEANPASLRGQFEVPRAVAQMVQPNLTPIASLLLNGKAP